MSGIVVQQQQQQHQQQDSNRSKPAAPNIWLPPGFRFHPTDNELITFYLVKKVVNNKFVAHAITEVDLNKFEPWDLPEKASMGEKEWYFFSLRDRKYPTGMRTNRATEAGYWKATGKDRDVRGGGGGGGGSNNTNSNSLVGMKKTLVFYRGRAPRGEKTNWVMHEYRLEGKTAYLYGSRAAKEEWVVCRIFQKKALAAAKLRGLDADDNVNNTNNDDQDVPCSPSIATGGGGAAPANFATKTELDDHLSGISGIDQHDIQQRHHRHHHHQCSAAKNFYYTGGDFAKLFDPEFLPGLNHRINSSSSPPSSCFSTAAANLMLGLTKSCKSENFGGGGGGGAPGSPLPPPLTDTAATPAANSGYNAFAGFLGDSISSSLACYDPSSQQQQQMVFGQQHSSSDQGLINELLFSRFLADPSSSSSSDLDQLYAF